MSITLLLGSVSTCNIAQFLPPTQSVVTLALWCSCFSQTGTRNLAFWLNVNILCSGGLFFPTPCCHKCHFCVIFGKYVFIYLHQVYSDVLLFLM